MRDSRQNKVAITLWRSTASNVAKQAGAERESTCVHRVQLSCANSYITEGEEPQLSKQALRSNHVSVLVVRRKQ